MVINIKVIKTLGDKQSLVYLCKDSVKVEKSFRCHFFPVFDRKLSREEITVVPNLQFQLCFDFAIMGFS